MLRDPSTREKNPIASDSLPNIEDLQTSVSQWHTLHCELITPMYGGGVESTKVDAKMPIRVSSIRGQLRFWWRLLAKHKWQLGDAKAIRKAEFDLWGGMNDGDEDGKASKVLLKVTNMPAVQNKLVPYTQYSQFKYVLFAADNADADEKETNPHKLLNPEGITWDLKFSFVPTVSEFQKNQVIETLQWWANFGGLGFRSRKGLGAFYVSECTGFPQICQPLTAEEVAEAGCQLVQKAPTPNAMTALETAISKLSDFRQKANIGRNPPSEEAKKLKKPAGRSRWSEPDALRRIKNTHHSNHAPEHPAGNIFPRAVFGLPIVFHFVGAREPSDTNLVPSYGDRLASPLILRPVFAGMQGDKPQWKASTLVLPYQHILDMTVEVNGQDYPIWNHDTAQHIKPIQENGGGDPLQAFLTYFAK